VERTAAVRRHRIGADQLVLAINHEVREEACAGLPPKIRDMLMRALDHMKGNLTLAEDAESVAAA
jgi:hypothetical protein